MLARGEGLLKDAPCGSGCVCSVCGVRGVKKGRRKRGKKKLPARNQLKRINELSDRCSCLHEAKLRQHCAKKQGEPHENVASAGPVAGRVDSPGGEATNDAATDCK